MIVNGSLIPFRIWIMGTQFKVLGATPTLGNQPNSVTWEKS